MQQTAKPAIRSMLSVLTYREAFVLTMVYKHGHTQAEVAATLLIGQQRVSSTIAEALEKLRHAKDFHVEFLIDA